MLKMKSIDDFDYSGKTVLLRIDINSPIDKKTKRIVNHNRIQKSIPTIRKILDQKARLAIIAHQGDTLDYQNLIPMTEHAHQLSIFLGEEVHYIDDVAGPAAQERIKSLQPGQALLLGNLRYLSEEISTFEDVVKLHPEEMLDTYLVRGLAPIIDCYVNDAFAAAHRNAPSMVAFQEIKPTAAGDLMLNEVTALNELMVSPDHPCVFVLGGAKISDAFGMMRRILESGTADSVLSCGITGEIMLLAKGVALGATKERFIKDRGLEVFIPEASTFLQNHPDRILFPADLAYSAGGTRREVSVRDLPLDEMFMDIGSETIQEYTAVIRQAKTVFINGPPGAYEDQLFEKGTRAVLDAIASCSGYTVIGGGDTVAAATRFMDLNDINYVCTAGGAMVRFISGMTLPLIQAMEKAYLRDQGTS